MIYKLLGFTAAMVAGPIGMYFLTLNTIFSGRHSFSSHSLTTSHHRLDIGSSTLAGATAAVTANVVLFAYIYVAWLEDQGDQQAAKEDSKKAQ